ncbi:hypothetical protein AB0E88_17150 [Streptomyces sp. NPDC028635]|uniref:hypothetical protein n=1 Tax=Streptomyces sp. NPDC028635 TaxID=3154800 RepID=UPI0033CFAE7A
MLYEEKIPKTWLAITTVLYLAGVAAMGAGSLPDDFGLWLGLSAMFLVLIWVPFNAVPLSKYFFNRIQVDAQTLRVGRERIALADLDPAGVYAASQQAVPTAPQRYATSLNTNAPVQARLVGGGWSVPMGMDSVVLTTRRGEALTIATRDRTAFLTALGSAVGAR